MPKPAPQEHNPRKHRFTVPALHIVLDTNALHDAGPERLFRQQARDLIETGPKTYGFSPTWYLPGIVREERRFQIIEATAGYAEQARKIETFTGHPLQITSETLEDSTDRLIKREIKSLNIKEAELNYDEVVWEDIVRRSVNRLPPFSAGRSEKGFRDALVLETFAQIVAKLPKGRSSARIVLYTGDGRLQEAAKERFSTAQNVDVVNDLGELRNFMFALGSHLTSEETDAVVMTASRAFFDRSEHATSGRYFDWKIKEELSALLGADLKDRLPRGWGRRLGSISIRGTQIVGKVGQRTSFRTPIVFKVELTRQVEKPAPPFPSLGGYAPMPDYGSSLSFYDSKSGEIVRPLSSTQIAASQPYRSPTAAQAANSVDSKIFGNLTGSLADFGRRDEVRYETEEKTLSFEVNVDWAATLKETGALVALKLDSVLLIDGGE